MKSQRAKGRRVIWLERRKRPGTIVVLAAAMIVMTFAFAAFTADLGYIALTKSQLQTAADAGALAAAMELTAAWGPGKTATDAEAEAAARQAAADVAGLNPAGERNSVYVDSDRDVRFGRREWDAVTGTWQETWGVPPYNVVEVTARRNVVSAGQPSSAGDAPLPLFFAPVIGHETADLSVRAVAALVPAVGFRVQSGSNSTADILPIALDEQTWNDLLNGSGPEVQDAYTYDPDTGNITPGPDGILEVNLYPNGTDELPPGNRGTVDFGSNNNSTADLARQILNGLNESDLSYFGGEIRFDQGPVYLNGDTGISAGIKDELGQIKGQSRAIPLFTEVSNPGNNATYTVTGFVGIRIVDVKLTGGNKYVYIQPAPFVASTAVDTGGAVTETTTLMAPAMLLR